MGIAEIVFATITGLVSVGREIYGAVTAADMAKALQRLDDVLDEGKRLTSDLRAKLAAGDDVIDREIAERFGNKGERGSQGEDTDPGTPAAMAAKVDKP